MYNLAKQLDLEGYRFFYERGKLNGFYPEGQPLDKEWIGKHQRQINNDFADTSGLLMLKYMSYDGDANKYEGIQMKLCSFGDGSVFHAYFNAIQVRSRRYKDFPKGSPLPKGQFSLSDGHNLAKVFTSSGIILENASKAYMEITKLRKVVLTGEKRKGERLNASKLKPLKLSVSEFRQGLRGEIQQAEEAREEALYSIESTKPRNYAFADKDAEPSPAAIEFFGSDSVTIPLEIERQQSIERTNSLRLERSKKHTLEPPLVP